MGTEVASEENMILRTAVNPLDLRGIEPLDKIHDGQIRRKLHRALSSEHDLIQKTKEIFAGDFC